MSENHQDSNPEMSPPRTEQDLVSRDAEGRGGSGGQQQWEPKEGSTLYEDYKLLLEGRRVQSRRQASQTVQERNHQMQLDQLKQTMRKKREKQKKKTKKPKLPDLPIFAQPHLKQRQTIAPSLPRPQAPSMAKPVSQMGQPALSDFSKSLPAPPTSNLSAPNKSTATFKITHQPQIKVDLRQSENTPGKVSPTKKRIERDFLEQLADYQSLQKVVPHPDFCLGVQVCIEDEDKQTIGTLESISGTTAVVKLAKG